MQLHCCHTSADYAAFVNSPDIVRRWLLEEHLARANAGKAALSVPGFCVPCCRAVDFTATFEGAWRSPGGVLVPNWRDYLRCPVCTMNGRQRMVAQLLIEWATSLRSRDGVSAYMMEQLSPLFRWASVAFPWVRWSASEYFDDAASRAAHPGVAHEDAEALTFADQSFDLVVSCDVLEHVNEPVAAMRETARVLRAGGRALLTFPMDPMLARNRRRAARRDGGMQHLLPEIYHGNPLSPRGSLVFTDFGWEVLDQLRAAGLPDATLTVYWAYELGYLGIQFYFAGYKR